MVTNLGQGLFHNEKQFKLFLTWIFSIGHAHFLHKTMYLYSIFNSIM